MFRSTISLMRALALVIALLVGPASAQMTTLNAGGTPKVAAGAGVAFDAVSHASVSTNPTTTLSWTHTPVGTPTAVAVLLENYEPGSAITGITYGGSAMTKAVQSAASASNDAEIWGLANPPSGAQTVTITFATANAFTQAGAITVTGSNTATTFDASNSAIGSSTSPSVSVTSATGEFVVDVVAGSAAGSQTQGGSQTLRWGPLTAGGNVASGSSAAAGAGSTSMTWTLGASQAWAQAAASFHK